MMRQSKLPLQVELASASSIGMIQTGIAFWQSGIRARIVRRVSRSFALPLFPSPKLLIANGHGVRSDCISREFLMVCLIIPGLRFNEPGVVVFFSGLEP